MKLTLWLTVREKTLHFGSTTLWTKTITTGQAPDVGEEVMLWPDDDGNPLDGPQWGVRRRYWDADGAIHCDLRAMVVDPNEDVQKTIAAELANRRWTFGTWYTATDGRPEPGLERGGWRPYL